MDKEYISIFKPQRVRKLLKKGFNIYDIKPDKNNLDRTIFIFYTFIALKMLYSI